MTGGGAVISECGTYRYKLWRTLWPPCEGDGCGDETTECASCGADRHRGEPHRTRRRLLFVMLNPSTANAEEDDPTIRKCCGFARQGTFAEVMVVNLGAYRATDPKDLKAAYKRGVDVVGPDNEAHWIDAIKSSHQVIFAWGAHASDVPAFAQVIAKLKVDAPRALRFDPPTKDGSPPHPLMLAYDTPLVAFTPYKAK